MTLSTGTRLSHYEITSRIGQGGMGEVYQAKDTKLGRDVAIKVLPDEFAKDADRIARFQREAKLLASLNHPNIAAIYGLEEVEGTNFLVMELVEGRTLEDYIAENAAGTASLPGTLELALQIAEALEAAHEKGVIHRDLKPANIKVTPDGKVKVLDFGLAKAFAGEQSDLNLSNSPTLSLAATQQGVILGTAAYMSPEQARGKEVDKRADIWSFGVVLFEMFSKRRLFSEETVSDTLASVLKTEPEWDQLPQNLHPRIRLMLERCLKKELKDRYSGISDARVDIQEALADTGGGFFSSATTAGNRPGTTSKLSWIAAIILVGFIVGISAWFLGAPESPQISRLFFKLPDDQSFRIPDDQKGLSIAPDGRQFVYLTDKGLYLRSMETWDVSLLVGPEEEPQQPFFSPDGKWVGYWSYRDKQLKKIAVSGGAPVPICNMFYSNGASWGIDNQIVYSEFQKGISQVSAVEGKPKLLVKVEGDEIFFPQILPSGKFLLFTQGSAIVVQSIESEDRKELFAGYGAQYLATGHIIYGLENDLYAVPFDPEKLEVTGDQILLEEDLLLKNSAPQFVVSDSGTLVYVTGSIFNQARLEWFDRQGNRIGSVGEPGSYGQFALSPNEKKVVIERGGDLWVLELDRAGIGTIFTSDEFIENDPIWSPDGNHIMFRSNRSTPAGLFRKALLGEVELFKEPGEVTLVPEDWSDDFIAYLEVSGKGDKIWLLPLSDKKEPESFGQEGSNYDEPKFSPDGKWLAYSSNEAKGTFEVYIKQLEGKGLQWRISTNGGGQPQWREDGRELFYLALDGSMMAVELKGETLEPGSPEELFPTGVSVDIRYDQYAVRGNGKEFLILNPLNSGDVSSVNIVLNCFEEMK